MKSKDIYLKEKKIQKIQKKEISGRFFP